jgi:hypothetical protein
MLSITSHFELGFTWARCHLHNEFFFTFRGVRDPSRSEYCWTPNATPSHSSGHAKGMDRLACPFAWQNYTLLGICFLVQQRPFLPLGTSFYYRTFFSRYSSGRACSAIQGSWRVSSSWIVSWEGPRWRHKPQRWQDGGKTVSSKLYIYPLLLR